MNITYAQWVDSAHTTIAATIDDVAMFVPNDMGNLHRQAIAKWENTGNEIEDYLIPTPPAITVVKAGWLRAALARTEKLAEVNAAVAQASEEKQELWEYATEYHIDDVDVVTIAAALDIDLRELFDLADAIRIERQG